MDTLVQQLSRSGVLKKRPRPSSINVTLLGISSPLAPLLERRHSDNERDRLLGSKIAGEAQARASARWPWHAFAAEVFRIPAHRAFEVTEEIGLDMTVVAAIFGLGSSGRQKPRLRFCCFIVCRRLFTAGRQP